LNPIENEAVVAAACAQMISLTADRKYKLLDVSIPVMAFMKNHRRGVSSWKVAEYHNSASDFDAKGDHEADDDAELARLSWYESYDEAKSAGMEHASPSMWPVDDNEVVLERCLRLWPQDHDTGGFFVAMIQRID
jgi:16S rRNA C967 or C1407 C5-methylase (RsmB/RsmF family)